MLYGYGAIPAITTPTTLGGYSSQSSPAISPDFARLLMAQMSMPDLSSLFSTSGEEKTSPFGTTSDIFSTLGGSTSALTGASNLWSGLSPQMELSIWSNLIGKTIEALEVRTGEKIEGKVKSVLLQNGVVYLDVDGTLIPPQNLTKVK